MGQVLSTMSSLIFGPASNAPQLLAATSTFGATGQARSHPTIHRPTQAYEVVVVEPPFQLFTVSISVEDKNRLQSEVTRVAQQTISGAAVETSMHVDGRPIEGGRSLGASNESLKPMKIASHAKMHELPVNGTAEVVRTRSYRDLSTVTRSTSIGSRGRSLSERKLHLTSPDRKPRLTTHLIERGDFFVGSEAVCKLEDDGVLFSSRFHVHVLDSEDV